jgi:hypothetical protein
MKGAMTWLERVQKEARKEAEQKVRVKLQEARKKALKEALKETRQEWLTKGILIGQIRLVQELLGQKPTKDSALDVQTEKALESKLARLRAKWLKAGASPAALRPSLRLRE